MSTTFVVGQYIEITVTQNGDKVDFAVTILEPLQGDMQGIFFDFYKDLANVTDDPTKANDNPNDPLGSNNPLENVNFNVLNFQAYDPNGNPYNTVATHVNETDQDPDAIHDVGIAEITGYGNSFDFAFDAGDQGAAQDKISKVTFTLEGTNGEHLDVNNFIDQIAYGIRLQSTNYVFDENGEYVPAIGGSLKIVGEGETPPPPPLNPDLEIVKVADVNEVDHAGQVIHYTITVENTGDMNLTGIQVTDLNADVLARAADIMGDNDDILEVGEIWSYTASHMVTQEEIDNGGVVDANLDYVNVAIVDTDQTDPEEDDAVTHIIQRPDFEIAKDADLSEVDHAGQIINYTITLTNTGNMSLTGIDVTDPKADALVRGADIMGDNDDILEVDEVWSYTASHMVTQEEIDNDGVLDSDLKYVNVAIADTDQTGPKEDDAETKILQKPGIDLVKSANTLTVDHIGQVIDYTITVDNTGNMTLTGIVVEDALADPGSILYVSGDDNNDHMLQIDETWTYVAKHTVTQAEYDSMNNWTYEIVNVATVEADQDVSDSDTATVDMVYIPPFTQLSAGYWTTHADDWNGVSNSKDKLLGGKDVLLNNYANALTVNGKVGLLIGDFDFSGVIDGDERGFFVNLADAKHLLNPSLKEQGDVRFILDRQLVASWLNYLAGTTVDAADPNLLDIKSVMNEAIDWMKATTTGGTGSPISNAVPAGVNLAQAWSTGIDKGDAGTIIGDHKTDIAGGENLKIALDNFNSKEAFYVLDPSSALHDSLQYFIIQDHP